MVDKKLIFNGVTGKQEEVDYTAEEEVAELSEAFAQEIADADVDKDLVEVNGNAGS